VVGRTETDVGEKGSCVDESVRQCLYIYCIFTRRMGVHTILAM